MTDIPRLLLIASLLSLGACATTSPTSVTLTHDRKCPLTLERDQTLIVSLPSNPTTGFRWTLEQSVGEVLQNLGPEVFSTPDNNPIGGDGVSTWRFRAAATGGDRLRLTYQQPWDLQAEPAGVFDCQITVR